MAGEVGALDDDLEGTQDATGPVPRWALDDDLEEDDVVTRPRWEVPELVAAGATLACAGLFVGFVAAGIDVFAQTQRGVSLSTLAIVDATSWVDYTVPLTLLAVLAAWWGTIARDPDDPAASELARRRLQPSLVVVAVLALPTVAAGIARFIDTLVNLQTPEPAFGRFTSASQGAAVCAMAVAGGWVQWVSARRLLRRDDHEVDLSPSPPPA